MKTFRIAALAASLLLNACANQNIDLAQMVKQISAPLGNQGEGQTGNAPATGGNGKQVIIDNTPVWVEGTPPSDPRWTGTPLRETKLADLFRKNPQGNCVECWPRVAITIKDYSESLMIGSPIYLPHTNNAVFRKPECLKFDAEIWYSAKSSEKIKDIVLCNAHIKASDHTYTRSQMGQFHLIMARAGTGNTGEIRTAGPKPPHRLLAIESDEDYALWDHGFYLFGNFFNVTGYQGLRYLDGILDDRVWFVNLSAKPAA